MNNGDIILLLLLVGAFIVGFVWGTARSLIFLGGGALVFLIAAHARAPLSGFLVQQWGNLDPSFNDMVSMLVLYGLGLVALLGIVWFGAKNTGLSQRAPDLDRLLGGLVAVGCTVMIIGGLAAALSLYYDPGAGPAQTGGVDWADSLHRGVMGSEIGAAINRSLLPALGSIVGPLLPVGFEEAFGAA